MKTSVKINLSKKKKKINPSVFNIHLDENRMFTSKIQKFGAATSEQNKSNSPVTRLVKTIKAVYHEYPASLRVQIHESREFTCLF